MCTRVRICLIHRFKRTLPRKLENWNAGFAIHDIYSSTQYHRSKLAREFIVNFTCSNDDSFIPYDILVVMVLNNQKSVLSRYFARDSNVNSKNWDPSFQQSRIIFIKILLSFLVIFLNVILTKSRGKTLLKFFWKSENVIILMFNAYVNV